MTYPEHYEESTTVLAPQTDVFAFADDHRNLSSHMNTNSWMMAGSKMHTIVDEGDGKKIGSHIRMEGKILGVHVFLDEVISEYNPPVGKVWHTVGELRLIVIGNYQLGYKISPEGSNSRFTVFINYELPGGPSKIIGILLGKMYARWCVHQMIVSVRDHFRANMR